MAETTPTQRSAHLIQGNSSASRPGSHMPVTSTDMDPDSWDRILHGARIVIGVLAVLFFLALGATALIAAGFYF